MDNPQALEVKDPAGLLPAGDHDILLELANLTGGVASSTLALLLDPDLELSPPSIEVFDTQARFFTEAMQSQTGIITVAHYQSAFESPIAFFLDTASAISIADVMMNGAISADAAQTISDIQLGAIGEAFSQMMGATASTLSQSLFQAVEVSVPEVQEYSQETFSGLMPEAASDSIVLFRYKISNCKRIPACELYQIMPLSGVQNQITVARTPSERAAADDNFMNPQSASREEFMDESAFASGEFAHSDKTMASAFAGGGGGGQSYAEGGGRQTPANPVTVQPVEFPSFDHHVSSHGSINKNLELVMDVSLNLTVELGRAELPIKEVLELTRGSVIELNRVAGESVDLYANGKMIAKGEVVVIEDNFGLRITSIVSPADRLRGL